jgi:cytosine/adenosine deaminase-related metal-dependent hydrolase
MTGFVNAHTHLYSGLVPFGLPSPSPPPATLLDVLRRFWWRVDRALDAPMLRAAARYYVADALLHGTDTLVDHHESPCLIEGSLDILADACHELGVRAVLCYGATERNAGRTEAERGLAECRRFIRENRRPLVRGVVGLHASFTVSDETIREAGEMCRQLDTVLHVHAAEDACDVDDAQSRGYEGVIDRLRSLGALPAGSVLAHGVHLTRSEVAELDSFGCWLVQNPRSNQQNRVGYPAALGASLLVALGTDGFPSEMTAEREAGTRLAIAHGEPQSVAAERLQAGNELVAQWFDHRSSEAFEVRSPASGVVPTFQTRNATPDGGLTSRVVDRLVIAGRTVVDGGRLVTGDWNAIREEAAEQAKRLAERMKAVASSE